MQLDLVAAFMDRRARAGVVAAHAAADCIACGLPIREDRLQAAPLACRCTRCQDRHERQEAARWAR